MATKIVFFSFRLLASPSMDRTRYSNALRSFALWIGLLVCSIPAHAQLQSAFVYAADPANPMSVAVYTRNDVTGVLTAVPGSPFPSKEPVNEMAFDFSGRFLFTASNNTNKVSMFAVDANTGALREVPNSPFQSAATNNPRFLSTESTGQFLYVINFNGSQPGASSVESFQIDAVNLDLIPSTAGATQLPGLFLSGATHPSGKSFYAFLNAPSSATPNQAFFLVFNSSTGKFTIPNPNMGSSAGTFGCCFALDPQGKSLALGVSSQLILYSLQSDGTLGLNPATGFAARTTLSMAFDTFGRFLYVDLPNPPAASPSVHIFAPATLLETSNSPLSPSFPSSGTWIVDPTALLIYADQVYQVDPQTGIPTPVLPANPIVKPAVFSRTPGVQPVLGPIVQWSASALSFGSLVVGQTSSTQTLTITSNGGQALDLNTLAITGVNPGDFAETDTCHVPTVLQPGASCSVLITFSPSATGSRSAALTITSNASPPTQSAQLSGTGLPPAPALTIVPGSLNFGSVTLGTSAPLNISVTNSGTAALHISSVVIGGANIGDYSSSSPACNSPIAVNSSCTVIATFTPLASGVRSASVLITDDAPGSPQTVVLNGTGVAVVPGVTFSPLVPSFPTITQGTSGVAQTLTVTNSGNAPLHVSSVALGGANAAEFSFTNNCTAPVAPASDCMISLAFSPVATGQRTANLTIADDAAGSPQIIALSATASPAFAAGAVQGSSTTASISAGQTAQYQMQLTPGSGYSGTVSLACSGAPLAATCQVPASVTLAAGAAAPFTVTVSTSGSALLPPSIPWRSSPPSVIRRLLLLALALVLAIASKNRPIFDTAVRNRAIFDGHAVMRRDEALAARRPAWSGTLTLVFLVSAIYAAGCGGGSSAVTPPAPATPPSPVTPSGTSTITVTPTAMSLSGKPLQLTPIQLTLTVK
jgi:hypothetical protein